jgi:deazaflavin-dependent oxidoreductase (nitroreductase family)
VNLQWRAAQLVFDAHTRLYRLTGGLIGHHIGPLPVLLLDHKGRRSGKQRTTPLLYVKDRDDLAVIASKGGSPKHPAWFLNLQANPDTVVQVGRRRIPVHARVATPAERKRLWAKAVKTYPGYTGYQKRTKRQIPVVVLEPR